MRVTYRTGRRSSVSVGGWGMLLIVILILSALGWLVHGLAQL